jgi:arginine decarboxylase
LPKGPGVCNAQQGRSGLAAAAMPVSGCRAPGAAGLLITVRPGVGTGPTLLAAFDAALFAAGVADFNLVRLSSVIPPGSAVIEQVRPTPLAAPQGDLLYCVYAAAYADIEGEEVWAGIAWASRTSDGAGIFVEHVSSSESGLRDKLAATLAALVARRPGTYEQRGAVLASVICQANPACALAIAAYQTASWPAAPTAL